MTVEVEPGYIIALIIGVVIPTLLFWWRLHGMTKHTRDMHLDPDEHGFGTNQTNQLLSQHMDDEMEMHREEMSAVKSLNYTIRELSHYIQWMAKQQTGKTPPPYVRGNKPDL